MKSIDLTRGIVFAVAVVAQCWLAASGLAAELPVDADKQVSIARSGKLEEGRAAIALLQEHASQKEAHAERALARCYEQGWSVAKDPKAAFTWYRAAADHGDAEALIWLSAFYLDPQSKQRDPRLALRLLREAESAGSGAASYFVGFCYEYGILDSLSKLTIDEHNVRLECLRQMMLAPSAGQVLRVSVGWSNNSDSVRPLPDRAYDAYDESLRRNYPAAPIIIIAYAITDGRELGKERFQACIKLLHSSDETEINACYLGLRQWIFGEYREMIPDDDEKIIAKLKRAAEKGDAHAMEYMAGAVSLHGGDSAPADGYRRKAMIARQREADNGDILSQYELAQGYEGKKYIEHDQVKAAHYYELAAKAGYPWAQLKLGKCYSSGLGVERNQEKADHWSEMAKRQGVNRERD